MSKLLFHEGGLDGDVLNKVIDGLSDVALVQASGKFGLASFMQGYEAAGRGVITPNRLMAFRDRDFDYPLPLSEQLIIPSTGGARVRVSYRTTIENYFLSPQLLTNFNHDKGLGIGALTSLGSAETVLDQVAANLLPYSAVRHALGATRRTVSLGTTWTGKSGTLPANLDRGYCQEQGKQLIETYRGAVDSISVAAYEAQVEAFFQLFSQPDFLPTKRYLTYFHGKDLMKLLSQRLGSSFSPKRYYRYALNHFDYTLFPDLIELRSWIESL